MRTQILAALAAVSIPLLAQSVLAAETLDVTQQGSEVRVNGRFKQGWKPGALGGWFNHGLCRDGKCLEYRRLSRSSTAS